MKLIAPTVHLNGTPRQRLLDQHTEASEALRLAIEAFEDCAPNGRDYYPQGPDAMRAAGEAHRVMLAQLVAIRAALVAQSEVVADAP